MRIGVIVPVAVMLIKGKTVSNKGNELVLILELGKMTQEKKDRKEERIWWLNSTDGVKIKRTRLVMYGFIVTKMTKQLT